MSKLADLAHGWDDIEEAGVNSGIKIGLYGMKVKTVTDYPDKEYIELNVDFAVGEYKDRFAEIHKTVGPKWPAAGTFRRSYKDGALKFFKQMITAFEKSNEGYSFKDTKGDVQKLVGKIFVGVWERKEIPVVGDDGKPVVLVKMNDQIRSTESYKDGKIKVPTEEVVPLNKYEQGRFEEAYNEWAKENNKAPYGANTSATVNATVVDDDLPF